MKSMDSVEINGRLNEMTTMQEICLGLIDEVDLLETRKAYQKEARKNKDQENSDECRKEVNSMISQIPRIAKQYNHNSASEK